MAGTLDVERVLASLWRNEELPLARVQALCEAAVSRLVEEPNVLKLDLPLSVVGDIHGQFYDLLKLFRVAGLPPERRFLFLGDFVDRGYFSLNTLLLLLALKVRHPDSVFLLRGNHEGRQITYGFYDECLRRYGTADAWLACTRVFEVLPVAATLGGRAFAVHGGLSPAVTTAAAIDGLSRRRELPSAGALCDLVWSDPDPGVSGWSVSPRGAGFLFGPDVADRFLRANGMDWMARAHQLVMSGYEELFAGRVVTVWSAPNYCYRCGNAASVLHVDGDAARTYSTFLEASSEERRVPERSSPPEYFL